MSQYGKLARKAEHSAIGDDAAKRERLRAGTFTRWQDDHQGKAVSATAMTKPPTGGMYRRDRLPASPSLDRRVLDRNMAFLAGDGVEFGTVRRWDNGAHKARKHRQGDFVADGQAR